MTSKLPKKPVVPGHNYTVTFGVRQTEKIEKAANIVNETPRNFIEKATVDKVKTIKLKNTFGGS